MASHFEKSKWGPAKTPGSAEEISEVVKDLDNENALLKWHAEWLEEQQGIDHLTGLKMRKPFEEELERLFKTVHEGETAERRKNAEHLRGSMVFIDVDHFKEINDTRGHEAGDEVLREIAKVLAGSVRSSDIVARWGGEEFAVFLRDTDEGGAVQEAEKIRKNIEELEFEKYPDLKTTASLGVVSSESSSDFRTLLRLADEAMYVAKKDRNKVNKYET